jgi:hydrogenase expression/formation protein HypC
MCLSLPVKVEEINGNKARVSVGGNEYRADISLLENVAAGDYILLHAGFGIQKINAKHARETIELMKEIKEAGRRK